LLADLLGRVAGRFPRRETRQSCGQMLSALVMELDDPRRRVAIVPAPPACSSRHPGAAP
jgi:hypothetical protein